MLKTQKKTATTENQSARSAPAVNRPPGRVQLDPCAAAAAGVEQYFQQLALSKVNQLSHCDDDQDDCPCHSGGGSGGGASAKVDLIVIIDTSSSMGSAATKVSEAVGEAIEQAMKECRTDLEVTYLGVENIWPGTVFTTDQRTYIFTHNGTVPLAADAPYVGYINEQGANAVQDLSKYAKWREGACRAIFYISDEELDSISPLNDFANETLATDNAIAEANLNNVTVFAHHLTYQNRATSISQNYRDLCNQTGGTAYFSNAADKDEYVDMLKKVICNACGSGCQEVEFPEVSPCISVAWGDSDCDCMETNDFEVLAITVCNCYSNVAFENLMIGQISVTDELGNPVALLPDGTSSVEIHPPGALCFGRLGPCTDNTPSCVTREVVLYTRGAKAGKYSLKFDAVCYSIAYTGHSEACFTFYLCKD